MTCEGVTSEWSGTKTDKLTDDGRTNERANDGQERSKETSILTATAAAAASLIASETHSPVELALDRLQ